MKKAISILSVISVFLFSHQEGISQNVSNSGNFAFWRVGGNSNNAGQGSSVFGTTFNQPIYMYTAGTWRATLFNNTGGFAINHSGLGTNTPGALLHIGDAFGPPGSAGHRTWMDVGTFCWQATDNMYVGLKDETALFGVDV